MSEREVRSGTVLLCAAALLVGALLGYVAAHVKAPDGGLATSRDTPYYHGAADEHSAGTQADALPMVDPWQTEQQPGIAVLRRLDPGEAAIEEDAALRARARALQQSPIVLAGRSYAPAESDEGLVDVFLTWDPVENRREARRVLWDTTLHGGPYAFSQDTIALSPARVVALAVIDIDGDGAREAITLEAGANLLFPVLLDFDERTTHELLPRGHGMSKALQWLFADLDADVALECVAVVPAQYCGPAGVGQRANLGSGNRFLIFDLVESHYQLSSIADSDPTDMAN